MKIPTTPSGPTPVPGGDPAREVAGTEAKSPAAPAKEVTGASTEKRDGVTSFSPPVSEPISRLAAALLERFRSPGLGLAPPKPPVPEKAPATAEDAPATTEKAPPTPGDAPAASMKATATPEAGPGKPAVPGETARTEAAARPPEAKQEAQARPAGPDVAEVAATEAKPAEAKPAAEQQAAERTKHAAASEKPDPWRHVANALARTIEAYGARAAGQIAHRIVQTLSTSQRVQIVDTIRHLKAGDPTNAAKAWRQVGPEVFTVKVGGLIQHVLRYSFVDGNGSLAGMVQQVRQSIDPSADAATGKGARPPDPEAAIEAERDTLQAMAGAAEMLHEAAMDVIRTEG